MGSYTKLRISPNNEKGFLVFIANNIRNYLLDFVSFINSASNG